MAEVLSQEPLLCKELEENGYSKRTPVSLCLAKWALKTFMWGFFIAWVGLIVINPSESLHWVFSVAIERTVKTAFNLTGSIFLLFSAPILIIAILAYIYIAVFPRENYEKKARKFPQFRLWTFPVLVDGPFGVVSAAELIGILLFSAYIIWAVSAATFNTGSTISKFPYPSNLKSELMIEIVGVRLGMIGMFCLTFLFLPVSRGSVLLRLIDIPFEHATRYHVWLGHLTMMLFTLHGLCFAVAWSMQGRFGEEMLAWSRVGVANLPGVISLIAGLFMWVTSLHPVRKNYFELFFYTHQLYVVFIVFLAMHVGDFIFCFSAGAIFLFVLDRFLRFCQSRATVDLISASCLPCGTVELVFSKPANLKYNALSFIFVQLREMSWLQWHPFSVSSSPLDGKHHISVLIKVLGDWTEKLRDIITTVPESHKKESQFQTRRITASVEGPYGHELAYHLTYENLILVAGGIGISPFLAILSDIFHRVGEKKPCLPKNILVVWSVKKSRELSLISCIDVQSLSPSSADKLNLDIQAYVTQESEPSLEEGKVGKMTSFSPAPMARGCCMSSLVGTGNNIMSGAYFAISLVGFIMLYGLLEVTYINPYNIPWWLKGLLFCICMVASTVIFGGSVVFFWNRLERRRESSERIAPSDENDALVQHSKSVLHAETSREDIANTMNTQYGRRPDFHAIFNGFSQRMGRADVGVIVCGPPGLQSTVAEQCRSQNIRGRWNQPIFHFNSHSFDL